MTAWVAIAVVAAYASLAAELTLLHVASVASSRGIWAAPAALVRGYSAAYRRVFEWPLAAKILAFGVPLLFVYGVYAYPLLVLVAGPDPFGDYLFTPRAWSDALGAALVVGGRALALAAAATIRRGNAQSGAAFRLHTSGPFRWSRNPGLLGMYAFVSGLWLITPSAAMLLGVALYAAYMDFKVRMEEDFLANKFGGRYLEYRSRTGRYLP
jgi:protein-S-isoprenylcysteine O-methyltransferase Ste14